MKIENNEFCEIVNEFTNELYRRLQEAKNGKEKYNEGLLLHDIGKNVLQGLQRHIPCEED